MNSTNTLSIRISKELGDKIRTIASAINCDTSEIVRRTCRYIAKHGISLCDANLKDKNKDCRLEEFLKVRNCPELTVKDDVFRGILEQRCDYALSRIKRQETFVTDKMEGRDYVVVAN